MTEQKFAKFGEIVYQIIKDGQPAELTDSYDTALRRLAIAFTSESEYASLGRIDEFPELATAELCGTFQQRLRFAIEQTGRYCEVAEHRVAGVYEKTSLVRTIKVITELDPGYELQSALYRAALGSIERDGVADKLAAIIADRIEFERIRKSDDVIVCAIIEASRRLSSYTFGAETTKDVTAFLNDLPRMTAERYHELAAKAFPQPAMSM